MKKLSVFLLALLLLFCAVPASAELAVGDKVLFGRYEQDGDRKNKQEPIVWDVVEINGGEATLLSEKILDYRCYHTSLRYPGGWDKSALRKWLNNSFLKAAFTQKERSAILLKEIGNGAEEAAYAGCKDGKATKDRVVLPSYAECVRFFGEMTASAQWMPEPVTTAVNAAAKEENVSPEEMQGYVDSLYGGSLTWWMRSSFDSGWLGAQAEIVDTAGGKPGLGALGGASVTISEGVRPMIFVDIVKFEKVS